MGIVGPTALNAQTLNQGNDMAQLYAGPHPYYETTTTTTPTPTNPTPTDPTPTPTPTDPPKHHPKSKLGARVASSRHSRVRSHKRSHKRSRCAVAKRASRHSKKRTHRVRVACSRLLATKVSHHGIALWHVPKR
jgi:hypothetical protein